MLQAGSLSGNLPKWREFTSDPWILQTVSGYHLEFETTPHQVNLPKFPKFTERETALIESEIKKLISKGAVTEVSPCDNEFISTVFLVPKKTGDFRPVINLKPLNQFVEKIHFKMENIRMALNCISSGDFMVSIDLACVASVSSRVIKRKFKSGSKKNMEGGGGEEKRKRLPANPTIVENAP